MVSVLTICLNEEEMIEQYLDYVSNSGVADEVVLVDGGSTDGTVAKIVNYLNKVGPTFINFAKNPMPDSFAEQRNFAKSLCRGDWILQVDVDEKYTPNLEKLIKPLTQPTVPYLAYSFPTYHLIQDEKHYNNRDIDPHVRLFKNMPEISYHRDVHEFLMCGKEIMFPHPSNMSRWSKANIKYMDKIRLLHYTQLRSNQDKNKKWEKYKRFAQRSAEAGIPVNEKTFISDYKGEVFEIPKDMLE